MTLQIAEQAGEPGGEPIAGQADGPDGGSVRHAAVVVKLVCLLALAAVATVAVWYFATAAGAAGGCGGG